MKKYPLLVVLLAAALPLAACGGAQPTEPPSAISPVPADYAGKTNPLAGDAEAVAAGQSLFQTNCASCHGQTGLGDGPAGAALNPPPTNLVTLNQTAGDDYLFWRIAEGMPGTSMPAWKAILSEEKIWQVVTFIRTLQ